jgi:ABC-type Fe3+ transport system substrate-binding protein
MKRILAALLALAVIVPALSACEPAPVIVYTDLSRANADRLLAPYIEKTGAKVEIKVFGDSQSLMNAVAPGGNDRYRGRPDSGPTPTPNPNPPDIVLTADMQALPQLADRGALESYMPPAAADIPYGASGGGYWYGFGGRGWVIAWNTDLVKKIPDGFQDLADTAYPMGAAALPNPEQYYYYLVAAYSIMGQDYTLNLMETMLLNDAQFARTPKEAMDGVAGGKFQIAVTTYALARAAKDAGSPVDFAFPDQGRTDMGAYVQFYGVGIAKGGRAPEAAKELDGWLLSPESEKLSVDIGLSDVTLRDVDAGAPVVKPLVATPDEVLRQADAASQAFNRLAGRYGLN